MLCSYKDRQTSARASDIVNYIKGTTDPEVQDLLSTKLHQEVHNQMYKLPSEETMLMTARIF